MLGQEADDGRKRCGVPFALDLQDAFLRTLSRLPVGPVIFFCFAQGTDRAVSKPKNTLGRLSAFLQTCASKLADQIVQRLAASAAELTEIVQQTGFVAADASVLKELFIWIAGVFDALGRRKPKRMAEDYQGTTDD